MTSEEDQQRAMLEAQLLQQEVRKVEEELEDIERKKMELDIVLSSLDEISKQNGDEALIPVGSGVFVKGKIIDRKKILINVGADVVIEKTIEEAKEIITMQAGELVKVQNSLEKGLQDFLKNVQSNKGSAKANSPKR